jgi:hypothetical protein
MVPKARHNPVHDADWGFILAELLEVPFDSGRAYDEVVKMVEVGGYLNEEEDYHAEHAALLRRLLYDAERMRPALFEIAASPDVGICGGKE